MNYKRNLKKLIDQVVDVDIVDGNIWYRNARIYCLKLSKKHNVSYMKVCGMLAALSPRNRWERNKLDTDNLINHLVNGTPRPLFGTYNKMVEKAERIFYTVEDSDNISRILNGDKIKAFFDNIYNADSMEVTVDTWMVLAAVGKYLSVDERPALTAKTYAAIALEIKDLALDLQLRPYELQAILWCAIRRLNNPALKDQK